MNIKPLFALFIFCISQPAWAQLSPAVVCTQPGLTVTQIECEALVAVYNQNGGAGWSDANTWGSADVGSWGGVGVSADHVVSLNRGVGTVGTALVGALPSELWSLVFLEDLRLSGGALSSLPPQIGDLVALENLSLFGLSGLIPPEVGNLTNLEILNFNNNGASSAALTGSIPATLGNLTNLRELLLNSNELTGNIPDALGNLSNLEELELPFNSLSGMIPVSLGNLSNLRRLDMAQNELTGTLPDSFVGLTSLLFLGIGRNHLDADANNNALIPASLTNWASGVTISGANQTVAGTNNPPVISGSPDAVVLVGDNYTFTPTASDPDAGDVLTFSISNQPTWANFNSNDGTLSGTPSSLDVGVDSNILISVSDGTATASLAVFSITVQAGTNNNPPIISGLPDTNVVVGNNYAFTPVASDPDIGDVLTFSISNQPAWASFNNADGTLSGTPSATDVGVYTNIIIQVSDGVDTASLPPFSITVQAGGVPSSPQQVPTLSFWAWALLIVLLLVSVKMMVKTRY